MPLTGIFDLYYVFVETLGGSVLMAFLIILGVFALIGFISRMSGWTMLYIMMIFSAIFWTAFIGNLVLVAVSVLVFIYVWYSIIRFMGGYTGMGT